VLGSITTHVSLEYLKSLEINFSNVIRCNQYHMMGFGGQVIKGVMLSIFLCVYMYVYL
jgi:hypothetical protein